MNSDDISLKTINENLEAEIKEKTWNTRKGLGKQK